MNAQLICNGYIYNKKVTRSTGVTTWRCAELLKSKCRAICLTRNNTLLAQKRSHCHSPHWNKIAQKPVYSVEEDLDEVIEIKTTEHFKLSEVLKTSQVEIHTGEYKVIVPPFKQSELANLKTTHQTKSS